MPQIVYGPQRVNPWNSYLPQFVSNMILQDQAQSYREKILDREQTRREEEAKIKLATTEGVSEVPTEGYAVPPSGNVFTAYGKQYSYAGAPKLPKGYYKAGDTLYKDIGGGVLEPVKHEKPEKERAPNIHFTTDDKGSVMQITNNPDGTRKIENLGKLGKSKDEGGENTTSWQAKTDYFVKDGKVYAQNWDFNPKTRSRVKVGEPYEAPRSVTEDIFDKLKKLYGGSEAATPSFQGPGIYRDSNGKEVKITSEQEWKSLIGAK